MGPKRRLILILGLWIALMPFLSFPISWRKPIFFISGLIIAYLAFILKNKKDVSSIPQPKTYSQNDQDSDNSDKLEDAVETLGQSKSDREQDHNAEEVLNNSEQY